ncbi:hypothetical protein BDC45DRAFT_538980 [Circinella umbellata]|nr:hypothetical protein BDC45DRAFT_538980 [Circinella umbellata]
MLLKPDEYSTTAREHFRKHGDILDQVYQRVITKIKRSDHKTFSRELITEVQDIIYVIQNRDSSSEKLTRQYIQVPEVEKGAHWECSRKLIELTKADLTRKQQFYLGYLLCEYSYSVPDISYNTYTCIIYDSVLKLPLKTMLDKTVIGETELWSQY